MTDTGNAFASGPPTPGIPVVPGVLLTLAHVFMSGATPDTAFG